jgi:hypothetical protein
VALYEALLLDTVALVKSCQGVDLAIAISPPESQAYFQKITPRETLLLPIVGANIGECLAQSFERLLKLGYRTALALNADGPSLPQNYLNQAISLARDFDVVFGPSTDGGYYLVAMKEFHPEIFINVQWSTEQVLAQSLKRAAEAGLRVALTPQWYDVDTGQDLQRLILEARNPLADRLNHTRRFLENFRLDVNQ